MTEEDTVKEERIDKDALAEFSGEYLFRLRRFVSKDAESFTLTGVLVQPHPMGGVIMAATDGHRLGVFYDRTGRIDVARVIKLTGEPLRTCKPKRRLGDPRVVLKPAEDGTIMAHVYAGERHVIAADPIIDGEYPDVGRVVPLFDGSFTPASAAYNPTYLGEFEDCCVSRDSPAIRIFTKSANDPALVKTDIPEFVGVIMPCRPKENQTTAELPDWAAPSQLLRVGAASETAAAA